MNANGEVIKWQASWTDPGSKRVVRVARSINKWGNAGARTEVERIRSEAERRLLPIKLQSSVCIVRLEGSRNRGWQLRWTEPIGGKVVPQSLCLADSKYGGRDGALKAAENCQRQVRYLLERKFAEL